eukprot:4733156-Lingulodinium_polyedra.AAC.1
MLEDTQPARPAERAACLRAWPRSSLRCRWCRCARCARICAGMSGRTRCIARAAGVRGRTA